MLRISLPSMLELFVIHLQTLSNKGRGHLKSPPLLLSPGLALGPGGRAFGEIRNAKYGSARCERELEPPMVLRWPLTLHGRKSGLLTLVWSCRSLLSCFSLFLGCLGDISGWRKLASCFRLSTMVRCFKTFGSFVLESDFFVFDAGFGLCFSFAWWLFGDSSELPCLCVQLSTASVWHKLFLTVAASARTFSKAPGADREKSFSPIIIFSITRRFLLLAAPLCRHLSPVAPHLF